MAERRARPRLRFWLIVVGIASLFVLGVINLVTAHPWLALLNLVGILVLVYVIRDEAKAKRLAEHPLRAPRPQPSAPAQRRGRRRP